MGGTWQAKAEVGPMKGGGCHTLVLQKYTPPDFISSSLLEFLGNQRFFTGGLIIKDGLGFPIACFEDMDCFGSNSGTKVYAEA